MEYRKFSNIEKHKETARNRKKFRAVFLCEAYACF